ncbi:hypothetical protein C1H46_002305 [Malus baccata]|uniref:Uncharacterized protein n=1 Tax=Malus baccata TaxID=106549 RepID=A0A540NM38_MALBA|nr:hypothetical protein C1H46_002305 [Malus baccata]
MLLPTRSKQEDQWRAAYLMDDDYAKPYERWFQEGVLGKDYRRPAGKRFGLDRESGWVMKVLLVDDMDEVMAKDMEAEANAGGDANT